MSASSLEKSLTIRYQFDSTITISKATLSRDVGKINPSIDIQNLKHASGMYGDEYSREKFYYVQGLDLVPPFFPTAKINKLVWSEIKRRAKKNYRITLVGSKKKAKGGGFC